MAENNTLLEKVLSLQDKYAQLQEQLEALSDSVEQGLPETLPQPDTGGSGEPGEGEGEGECCCGHHHE